MLAVSVHTAVPLAALQPQAPSTHLQELARFPFGDAGMKEEGNVFCLTSRNDPFVRQGFQN